MSDRNQSGKTLREVLPHEFFLGGWEEDRAMKLVDVKIIRRYDTWKDGEGWIGKHKNVHIWWELENGYAVGWNENPSRGWSFPVIKIPWRNK